MKNEAYSGLDVSTIDVYIADGESDSGVLRYLKPKQGVNDLLFSVRAVQLPDSLTGTSVQVLGSVDGVAFSPIIDPDTEDPIAFPVVAGYYPLKYQAMFAVPYVRFRTVDGGGTGVNQTADRTLKVVLVH